MNALELADLLEVDSWYKLVTKEEIATMLRQQEAEIEALKLQLHTTLTNRDLRTYDGKLDIANEPVAWMLVDASWNDFCRYSSYPSEGAIPLYTHPVKDLEDIDINITWNENSMRDFGKDELNFARAILRKAQE